MVVSNDILSSLPESLLSAIISFLPFKEAVRTSILSKDWVKVCKSTTKIEFNELFFVKVAFARKWIENHGEDVIDKFSLTIVMPEL
ncbi:F-box/RNI/FBD-like domain protein [Medicago truncatula]|uniref:F-box/RNI/FBD-like domain protein n=1 Tax=Medicago truncatula TaxID=3880 RepID=G7JYJ0_MEDTR|nr:F-box/RNI/FBD-like domain protein [Medicago truncatula]